MRTLVLKVLLIVCTIGIADYSYAQNQPPEVPLPAAEERRADRPSSLRDALARQQLARAKRNHEQMVARGNEALEIAEDLKKSVEDRSQLSSGDLKKIEDLEKLVSRIRRDLGGSGGGLDTFGEGDDRPVDVRQAVIYLTESTGKLVEELQKSSRFTISAVAINTSNAVIRLTKFLRARN